MYSTISHRRVRARPSSSASGPRPHRACALAVLTACGAMPAAHAADAPPTLPPVVVTAPMQTDPLMVVTDPKAPHQPVPASDGADFLKSIPGFSSIRKGGSNGDPLLRGMAGSRLNILIDGGQIGGGCAARMDPPTAYISPQLFDKVTVIKGPQTVLYGPGNSAGTVLFEREFSRDATPNTSFEGSLLGGSAGRNDKMIDARAGAPEGYVELRANHTHAQDYRDGDGRRVHSVYDRWNADVALGWTPDDDTRLEWTVGKGDGHAAYASGGMDGAQFLRKSAGVELERRHLSENFDKLEAQVYYNYTDHVMDNYTLRRPAPQSMLMVSDVDRRMAGGRVAGTWRWADAWQLVAGFDGSDNTHTLRKGGPPGSRLGDYREQPRKRDARLRTLGGFGEMQWTMAKEERAIGGMRVDRVTARGYDLPPGTGAPMGVDAKATANAHRSATLPSGFLRYERDLASMPATFYAGIGHVQRFPDYWELSGRRANKTMASFTRLRPEKTTQLDVGLQHRSARLQAWVSGYAGVVDDFILFRYGHGANGRAANVKARIAGGEAGLVYAFAAHWKLDATLAYAWGFNRSERRPLPQMPPLEAQWGLTYDTGTWSAGALWRLASAQRRVAVGEGNLVGQDLGPSAGFGVFSLNAGYRLGHGLTLSAGIDNLLDKTYSEHVNAANVGLVGYVNTVRVHEPGRTGWLKLALDI